MAPPQKTTPEQQAWLTAHLSKFSEYQKSKKVPEFWVELDRDWFARWPEPGVAEAECEPPGHPSRDLAAEALRQRKLQLKNWFNNRTLNKKKAPIKIEPLMPPTRSHQPVEVYSKLFYKEKVQPLVKAEIEERGIKKEDRLNIVKKLTQDAFDMEPEEVRQEIFAQAASLKVENAKRKAQARKAEPDTSPEAYAAAIESVPDILDVFFRDLALRTGWAFSVLCGGPNPANGGRIQTISFHEGKNFLGASFKKSHISFEQSVLKPYVEFLGQIYTPGECTARALPESVDNLGQGDSQSDPRLPLVAADMLSSDAPPAPPAPAALMTGDLTVPDAPSDSMALIDPTLHPTPSPPGVSAAAHASAGETASTDKTTVSHGPPLLPVDTTGLTDTLLSSSAPTTNGQPFIFPSTISFAPQDSIGSALHIPPAIVPIASAVPAVHPSPLGPVPPQGPFTSMPTLLVPPSTELSAATQVVIPPTPKAKKRVAVPKKKGEKRISVKAKSKAVNLEPSTAVPNSTVESMAPSINDQVTAGLQTGRGQRIRKAAVSKEVVPLTEDPRVPKRKRTQ